MLMPELQTPTVAPTTSRRLTNLLCTSRVRGDIKFENQHFKQGMHAFPASFYAKSIGFPIFIKKRMAPYILPKEKYKAHSLYWRMHFKAFYLLK